MRKFRNCHNSWFYNIFIIILSKIYTVICIIVFCFVKLYPGIKAPLQITQYTSRTALTRTPSIGISRPVKAWIITQVIESVVLSLVLWCSGYHICFTRRRSPVRPWAGSDFVVTALSRTKWQVSRLILDCIYYLQIVIYSAQLCHPKLALPHPKQYRCLC